MIRSKEVVKLTGLSKTTLWRMEMKGEFPRRRKLSTGTVGWSLTEVEEWMSSRKVIISKHVSRDKFEFERLSLF